MSGDDKQLELEALAAVGEMLLFDQARGNPEEAARILRCARLFARSEDAAQRLSELCNEAGSDATWRENIVEELQDREDLQAAEAAMEARRQAQLVAQADSVDTALQTLMDEVAADTFGSLDEGYAAQASVLVPVPGWHPAPAWRGRWHPATRCARRCGQPRLPACPACAAAGRWRGPPARATGRHWRAARCWPWGWPWTIRRRSGRPRAR